jgi:hypothetical protein
MPMSALEFPPRRHNTAAHRAQAILIQVNVEGRRLGMFLNFRTKNKKQGATGITTVAERFRRRPLMIVDGF